MQCCCCVPLGMALHIVAFFDIIAAVFLVIQGVGYLKRVDYDNKSVPAIYNDFYKMIGGMCLGATGGYSIPRTLMYFLTLGRTNSFKLVQWYFRIRILTLLALFVTLGGCFVFCFLKADQLVAANSDLNRTLILVVFGSFASIWLILDFYWTMSLRTYSESKKDPTKDHLLMGARDKKPTKASTSVNQ